MPEPVGMNKVVCPGCGSHDCTYIRDGIWKCYLCGRSFDHDRQKIVRLFRTESDVGVRL